MTKSAEGASSASAASAATAVQDSSCSSSYDHDEKKDQKEEHHHPQQQRHPQQQQPHHHLTHHHHAVVVESADVRQARKGLLKVLLEHNFMPKFSSTPVLLRDNDNAATMPAAERTVDHHHHHTHHAPTQQHHTSITASERDYLESLLQSGDAQHLRAASDRLQDVTLFPKEQQQPQVTSNDSTASTEQRCLPDNTNTNHKPRRRDSRVQQQLFKLHEQAGVHQRPSAMLQRMMQQQHASTAGSSSFHNNSLLVQESSLSFDDSNSIVDYAAANSRTAISRRQQALQQRTNSILESGTMDEAEMAATNNEATGTAAVAEAGADDDDDFLSLEEQDGFDSGGSKGIGMGLFATVGRQKVASRPMYYRQQNSILAGENNDDAATITSTTDGVDDDDDDGGAANLTKANTTGCGNGTLRTATTSAAGTMTTTGQASSSLASSGTTFRILGTWADDVSCHPHVLSPPLMESLLAFIPESMAENYHYYLKYSLVRDGGGIATLLRHARASHTTILAIETTDGHVFGSFTGVAWRLSRGWYGSSEAFLWKMRRSRRTLDAPSSNSSSTTTGRQRSIVQQAMQESEIQVFPFRPGNVAVQYCSKECIMLGQGELLVTRNNNKNAATNTTVTVAHAAPSAATSVSALPPTEQASSPHSSARKPDEEGTTTTTATQAESAAPTTASHGSKHYGHGLYLQADLLGGTTSTSETFGNPCLVNDTLRGARFQVENLEVWTLTPHDTLEQAQESELSSLFLEGDDYPKKELNLLGILVGGSNS